MRPPTSTDFPWLLAWSTTLGVSTANTTLSLLAAGLAAKRYVPFFDARIAPSRALGVAVCCVGLGFALLPVLGAWVLHLVGRAQACLLGQADLTEPSHTLRLPALGGGALAFRLSCVPALLGTVLLFFVLEPGALFRSAGAVSLVSASWFSSVVLLLGLQLGIGRLSSLLQGVFVAQRALARQVRGSGGRVARPPRHSLHGLVRTALIQFGLLQLLVGLYVFFDAVQTLPSGDARILPSLLVGAALGVYGLVWGAAGLFLGSWVAALHRTWERLYRVSEARAHESAMPAGALQFDRVEATGRIFDLLARVAGIAWLAGYGLLLAVGLIAGNSIVGSLTGALGLGVLPIVFGLLLLSLGAYAGSQWRLLREVGVQMEDALTRVDAPHEAPDGGATGSADLAGPDRERSDRYLSRPRSRAPAPDGPRPRR